MQYYIAELDEYLGWLCQGLCVCVQARTEEWVAVSYSRTFSHGISCIFCIGMRILYHAIWEAPNFVGLMNKPDLHGCSWWGTHSYVGDLLYLFSLTLCLPCFEYLAQPQNPQTPQTCLLIFVPKVPSVCSSPPAWLPGFPTVPGPHAKGLSTPDC